MPVMSVTLACGLFLPQFSQAQQGKLSVQAPSTVTVKRGASGTAIVHVSVLPGYHVNSNKPKDEFLIPLQLTFPQAGPLKPGPTIYPTPQDVQVGQDKLSVFTGDFDLKTSFSAPAEAPTGTTNVIGKLHYQACNDRMCFRPLTVDVHVPVVIE